MMNEKAWKEWMIHFIGNWWNYDSSELEQMSTEEVAAIYNRLIDWLENIEREA